MFKVGDVVECINKSTSVYLTEGKTYTVQDLDSHDRIYIINDEGRNVPYHITHFKLVPNFRGGDIVTYFYDHNLVNLTLGKEYKILAMVSLEAGSLDKEYKISATVSSERSYSELRLLICNDVGLNIDYPIAAFKKIEQSKNSNQFKINQYENGNGKEQDRSNRDISNGGTSIKVDRLIPRISTDSRTRGNVIRGKVSKNSTRLGHLSNREISRLS